MTTEVMSTTDLLLPLLRQFSRGEYGIALGGAHAKGVDDQESDIDLYVFAREILTAEERRKLCEDFGVDGATLTAWGDDAEFIQAGSDFYFHGQKVECWFRNIDYIDAIIAECQAGIVKHSLLTWTVMGFYNHCTLSDLHNMRPIDDPHGILARWHSKVGVYPPKLREAIISRYTRAAQFWPDNFHYKSAVERADAIYTAGIVQQVIHNLIQVVFALNRTYFPGDKKLEIALNHLAIKPQRFTERIQGLLFPGDEPDPTMLDAQRQALCALVQEVIALTEGLQ
ncbi:MAG: nucleotidyltransferase domain-containing protein [Anaerolineae bacterium]|nr:nucleotidyltransferase domain-containing protein [Anaerolineae bacterium]